MSSGRSRSISFRLSPTSSIFSTFESNSLEYKGVLRTLVENPYQLEALKFIEPLIFREPTESLYIILSDGKAETFSSNKANTVTAKLNSRDISRGKYNGAVVTHNHPDYFNSVLSPGDLDSTAGIGANQVRAVDMSGYTSVLSFPSHNRGKIFTAASSFKSYIDSASFKDDMEKVMLKSMPKVVAYAHSQPIRTGQFAKDLIEATYHKVQTDLLQDWLSSNAKKYGYEYSTNADTTSLIFEKQGGQK